MTNGASPTEFPTLPPSLRAERQGAIAILKLKRPEKRNALDDTTVEGIHTFFSAIPDGVGAVVLRCQRLDSGCSVIASEIAHRCPAERMRRTAANAVISSVQAPLGP